MTRGRLLLIVLVAVVSLAASGLYLADHRRQLTATADVAPARTLDRVTVLGAPHLVFRSTTLGATYGHLSAVPLAEPSGPTVDLALGCERVYATASSGVCLSAKRGVVTTYRITTLDAGLEPTGSADLAGLPSRARISADGRLVATTTFVTGHSYAAAAFSTETVVRRDGTSLGNLEKFRISVDGRPLDASNRNVWGVTFDPDGDTFYATAASGRMTWLMRGSLSRRTLESMRTDAECPSLSPDGTKVAYKKRLGESRAGVWRLAVLDLATSAETVLAETRSVDDQVEWLDDGHLLYALPRAGTEATTSDIWRVPADGSGPPTVFLEHASSPAVVRS